jgi:hypothetical protein
MRTKTMTQSQRIGTVLPSDFESKRGTDSRVNGTHRPSFVRDGFPVCSDRRVCAHCGSEIQGRHPRPLQAQELILNCLCCAVLIAVVLSVGHFLYSSAERDFDHLFDGWVWHEQLPSWNL